MPLRVRYSLACASVNLNTQTVVDPSRLEEGIEDDVLPALAPGLTHHADHRGRQSRHR